jgi:hypothetical protein
MPKFRTGASFRRFFFPEVPVPHLPLEGLPGHVPGEFLQKYHPVDGTTTSPVLAAAQ